MKVKYFNETDAALLEFSSRPVDETREISENIYVDLDAFGHLVSMTIERGRQLANLPEVVVQEIEHGAA